MKDFYMTPTEIASFCNRPERIGRVAHIEFNGVDHYSCMLPATGVVNCLPSVYNLLSNPPATTATTEAAVTKSVVDDDAAVLAMRQMQTAHCKLRGTTILHLQL